MDLMVSVPIMIIYVNHSNISKIVNLYGPCVDSSHLNYLYGVCPLVCIHMHDVQRVSYYMMVHILGSFNPSDVQFISTCGVID